MNGKKIKILLEGAGSPVFMGHLTSAIMAGMEVVACDIQPLALGLLKSHKGYIVHRLKETTESLPDMINLCKRENIDIVIPSIDEELLRWVRWKEYLRTSANTLMLISPEETIQICQDKWETYKFFKSIKIPTPQTNQTARYGYIIKPRRGRGSKGIFEAGRAIDMRGRISQQFIMGTEYTTDVLCSLEGKPIYIVTRERIKVMDGKMFIGKVVKDKEIEAYIKTILKHLQIVGPANIQCIKSTRGYYKFIEINPRISGGLALSMAATENWFSLFLKILAGEKIKPKPIQYGLMTLRSWCDYFVKPEEIEEALCK